MSHYNISHVILNRTFEYSANLDLSLQPLLKITDHSASDVSVELSHSQADRLFTYLGYCRHGKHGPGKTYPYVYESEYSDYEDIGNVDFVNCAWIRMYYVVYIITMIIHY